MTKGGDTHGYNDAAHKHAVTHVNGQQVAWYDANGNMTQRTEGGRTYQQQWDVDNRLVAVTDTLSGEWARFAYDADGQRVKREDAAGATYYQGNWFELSLPATTTLQTTKSVGVPFSGLPWTSWPVGARVRTYYYLGTQRVALRDITATSTAVTFLHGDHLGSASLATDATKAKVGELRYLPFGQERTGFVGLPTDRTFTGQRRENFGLLDYNARYYSPGLGRFLSADSIVPQPSNPQSLNRYSYVEGNPIKRVDPTGHGCDDGPQTWAACNSDGYYSAHVYQAAGARRTKDDVTLLDYRARLWTTGYFGFIVDNSHVRVDVAKDILQQVQASVGKGGPVYGRHQEQGVFGHSFGEFVVTYRTSDKLRADQVIGVALAIYLDYQYRWERDYQGTILGLHPSVFSPEDMPSDYLGFVSAVTGRSIKDIVGKDLSGVVAFNQDPPHFNGLTRLQNFSPTPQTPNGANYPWPDSLSIAPIVDSELWHMEHAPRVCPLWGIC